MVYAIFLSGPVTKKILIGSIPVLRRISESEFISIYSEIAVRHRVLKKSECTQSRIFECLDQLRILLMCENIYIPLGCGESKTLITSENIFQKRTNVCFCIDKRGNRTHIFLSFGEYAIELNSPDSSSVRIILLTGLIKKYEKESSLCFFGNIDELATNIFL